VLNELGRHQEAADSCATALRMAPGNAEAHNNLANALQGLGRYVEALESYQRALTIRPDYADAHNNRATRYACSAGRTRRWRVLPRPCASGLIMTRLTTAGVWC
jgi:tetratricopeptide (TPR) repeat protein